MNEKIKLLAEQAGDYVNEVYTPPVRSKTPGKIWEDGHVDWMEQFNEKFAELIVKECAELCMKKIDTGLLMAPQAPEMAKQILQHFGVEE